MDDKRVILLAVVILIVALVIFDFGSGVTGSAVGGTKTKIYVDKTSVSEGDTVKVTVTPGSRGLVNKGTFPTSPVYLILYRINSVGESDRTSYRMRVCSHNRCTDKFTTYFRIPSSLITGTSTSSGQFYLGGIDGSGEEVRAYFTVKNADTPRIDKSY